MQEIALHIEGLEKTYATGTRALNGVSLTVPAGDFFALLGPNGAGKSTLIGIATGLVTKTAGTVSVFGYDIDREPSAAKAAVGLVGQEVNFNPFERPIDIVVNQAGYYGIPRSVAIPRAKQLLGDLGLAEKMTGRAMALSGGMKRRLMIARALAHEPRFLVLDEPTAGVDVELRRGMWEYLRTLTKGGLTILLTTHYLEEAEQLAKRVAIINKGSIVAEGAMQEVLATLSEETVLVDLALQPHAELLATLSAYHPVAEGTTLALVVSPAAPLSAALRAIDAAGAEIRAVRPRTGRLEELFVKLTA